MYIGTYFLLLTKYFVLDITEIDDPFDKSNLSRTMLVEPENTMNISVDDGN